MAVEMRGPIILSSEEDVIAAITAVNKIIAESERPPAFIPASQEASDFMCQKWGLCVPYEPQDER
jgi:hypothetical protein